MRNLKLQLLSLFLIFSVVGKSQNGASFIAADDPIAFALDSFATKKFLDKYYSKPITPKTSKFFMAPDSVPVCDDFVYEARLSKLDALSPFDLGYQKEVRPYIELYTLRRRALVSRMLAVSQLYYPMFEEVLDKYNLPLELKHLAIIESALNPVAKSHAGATGLWQFMYQTGKIYGLNVSSYIDDRCDPYKATIAAAEYMQFLYKMFHDWQMVLAAYNAGPGSINHAIRRSGGKKTYWEIRPYLPKETQAYVPAFIAANYVMNYHAEHNIYSSVPKKMYFELDTVVIREPLTFEQLSGILETPVEEIQYFNPTYKKNIIPAGGYVFTMPKSIIGKFINNEEAIYALLRKESEEKNLMAASMVKEKQVNYVVKKNDKLSTIAKKFGVTVADLKTWNYIGKKGLRPGKKMVIYIKEKPVPTAPSNEVINEPKIAEAATTQVNKPKLLADNPSRSSVYKVKKGDTLYRIAKIHNMSIDALLNLNGININTKLSVGQKIKVSSKA